jgi:hypothetical protein
MADDKNRREVVINAARVAFTAPVAVLLLDAATKSAMALTVYGGGGPVADGGADSGDSGGTDAAS